MWMRIRDPQRGRSTLSAILDPGRDIFMLFLFHFAKPSCDGYSLDNDRTSCVDERQEEPLVFARESHAMMILVGRTNDKNSHSSKVIMHEVSALQVPSSYNYPALASATLIVAFKFFLRVINFGRVG